VIDIYLDSETSGLSPNHGAVVLEVGAVAADGPNQVDVFTEICFPGEDALCIPGIERALEVNKLTLKDIREARHIADVARDFREWLNKWGSVELHAYNNSFDSRFFYESPWEISKLAWGACVMLTVSGRGKWMKLREAAVKFGLEWEGAAHSALADARMAHRVHWAYKKRNGLVIV
jgi:DNA polymerase III epsilon subunit-like protein